MPFAQHFSVNSAKLRVGQEVLPVYHTRIHPTTADVSKHGKVVYNPDLEATKRVIARYRSTPTEFIARAIAGQEPLIPVRYILSDSAATLYAYLLVEHCKANGLGIDTVRHGLGPLCLPSAERIALGRVGHAGMMQVACKSIKHSDKLTRARDRLLRIVTPHGVWTPYGKLQAANLQGPSFMNTGYMVELRPEVWDQLDGAILDSRKPDLEWTPKSRTRILLDAVKPYLIPRTRVAQFFIASCITLSGKMKTRVRGEVGLPDGFTVPGIPVDETLLRPTLKRKSQIQVSGTTEVDDKDKASLQTEAIAADGSHRSNDMDLDDSSSLSSLSSVSSIHSDQGGMILMRLLDLRAAVFQKMRQAVSSGESMTDGHAWYAFLKRSLTETHLDLEPMRKSNDVVLASGVCSNLDIKDSEVGRGIKHLFRFVFTIADLLDQFGATQADLFLQSCVDRLVQETPRSIKLLDLGLMKGEDVLASWKVQAPSDI